MSNGCSVNRCERLCLCLEGSAQTSPTSFASLQRSVKQRTEDVCVQPIFWRLIITLILTSAQARKISENKVLIDSYHLKKVTLHI